MHDPKTFTQFEYEVGLLAGNLGLHPVSEPQEDKHGFYYRFYNLYASYNKHNSLYTVFYLSSNGSLQYLSSNDLLQLSNLITDLSW